MEAKSKSTAFLLCCFLGALGVHRFYLNRVFTGLLMLVSGGGLGIWWLADSLLLASGRLTDGSGTPLRLGPPEPGQRNAGFWVRAAAFAADNLVLTLAIAVGGGIAAVLLPLLTGSAGGQALAPLLGPGFAALALLCGLAYFTFPTASRRRATWGKRAFGLYVATTEGERVGFGRALWRTLCYVFSSLPLYLGFALAGLGDEKRALHDRLAGTRVLYADGAELAGAQAAAVLPPAAVPAHGGQVAGPVQRGAGLPVGMILMGLVLLGAAAFLALE